MDNSLNKILFQLSSDAKKIEFNEKKLLDLICNSHHIFLAGAGRSGLSAKAFANRLLHLGFDVSVIGEITSPHTHPSDLLIVVSSSGETESLKCLVKTAKSNNVKIITLTTNDNSTISKYSEQVILLPGKSKYDRDTNTQIQQPMGAEFEQMSYLFLDGIVLDLKNQLNITEQQMFANHADLE